MLNRLNQNYFSPYLIFINGGFWMSDKEIMESLDLDGYKLVTDEKEREKKEMLSKQYLFLTEDDEWTHLMDGWGYDLWHDKNIRTQLQLLSKDFDIFTCSVGDVDDSFDFHYYTQGEIVREYIVEDPHFKGGHVTKNFGQPFPAETAALQEKEIYAKVTTIAKSLGINLHHTKEQVRVYGKKKKAI